MRAWREANLRTATKTNPAKERQYVQVSVDKKRAHNAVQRAIKAGNLNREPCEKCGAKKAHAHHDDYSKPLQVRWLCAKDHAREHKWIS